MNEQGREYNFLPDHLKGANPVLFIGLIEGIIEAREKTQVCLSELHSQEVVGRPGHTPGDLYFTLRPSYLDRLIPPDLFKQVKTNYNAWNKIHDRTLMAVIAKEDSLPDDIKKSLAAFWKFSSHSSGEVADRISGLYRRSSILALQNSRAPEVLQRMAELEEKALSYFSPEYLKIAKEEDPEFDHLSVWLGPEPEDISQAIDKVRASHRATLLTLKRYQTQNSYHIYGGYGEIYNLSKQDGYFASLLPPQMLKEERELIEGWNIYKKEGFKEAVFQYRVKKGWQLGKSNDPLEDTEQWDPNDQDEAGSLADDLLLKDPKSLHHFQAQANYEDRLLAYLEGLEDGILPTLPQCKGEMRQMVGLCHELTGFTIQTYQTRDYEGWRGGYRLLYDFLKQPDQAQRFFPLVVISEGINISDREVILQKTALKESILKSWGLDIHDDDPHQVLDEIAHCIHPWFENENYLSSSLDKVRARSVISLFNNPAFLNHLDVQSGFEGKLLHYLH